MERNKRYIQLEKSPRQNLDPKLNHDKNSIRAYLLVNILESLIAEKRAQYRAHLNLSISFQWGFDCFCTFVNLSSSELKYVIVNIINNGVEALKESGKIEILLNVTDAKTILEIRDNGVVISEDIIPKLMNRGATYNKLDGSGLGLFSAKNTIEKWNGKIQIESKLGKGTSVFLTLPLALTPGWFCIKIQLDNKFKIVIIDDDLSIHQI